MKATQAQLACEGEIGKVMVYGEMRPPPPRTVTSHPQTMTSEFRQPQKSSLNQSFTVLTDWHP
ncbi:hypothetical protein PTKU46_77970 [Paraburkholderia terrae]